MEKFPQAGIAIGVIEQGKVTHLKGYGVKSIENKKKVDENTLFAIASNSKAFTATALGILADQGKLSWNDRVVTYIPEFKMYDTYVTNNFTIIDLLTHRSGLGMGAGDLIFFPDGSEFTFSDLIESFQYQTPTSDFRTKYDYDNLLYVVAGEVIKRVSGKTWDQFIEEEIMRKLGMKNSVGLLKNITQNTNVAAPHSSVTQKVVQLKEYAQ
jgi:CubicO group peptidase (beta-lactamase class C family)